MLATIKALFPDGADYANAAQWAGLRPMTPKGTPILGRKPAAEPVPQHRPRPHRLDHVAGLRPHRRRRDCRPRAAIDTAGLTLADA